MSIKYFKHTPEMEEKVDRLRRIAQKESSVIKDPNRNTKDGPILLDDPSVDRLDKSILEKCENDIIRNESENTVRFLEKLDFRDLDAESVFEVSDDAFFIIDRINAIKGQKCLRINNRWEILDL